jgi:hypothetical protein
VRAELRYLGNDICRAQSAIAVDVCLQTEAALEQAAQQRHQITQLDAAVAIGITGDVLRRRCRQMAESHQDDDQRHATAPPATSPPQACTRGAPGRIPAAPSVECFARGHGGPGVGVATRTTICAVGPVFPWTSRNLTERVISPAAKSALPATN